MEALLADIMDAEGGAAFVQKLFDQKFSNSLIGEFILLLLRGLMDQLIEYVGEHHLGASDGTSPVYSPG